MRINDNETLFGRSDVLVHAFSAEAEDVGVSPTQEAQAKDVMPVPDRKSVV